MLHHISFAVRDPETVATALADLMGGRVSRLGPLPGGYIAWTADRTGTAIEVYPRGTELAPGDSDAPVRFGHNWFAQDLTATHAAVSVPRSQREILAWAQAAGWSAAPQDRGGFTVVEVWVEDRVMLEVLTPQQLAAYLRVIDAPRVSEGGAEVATLSLSVQVATDPATAWRAWTCAPDLLAWWPLHAATIDLRIDGAFDLRFVPDAGRPGSGEGNRVLSYVPDRMLSFTWNPPAHRAGDRGQSWVTVTFTDDERTAATQVELAHSGFAPTDREYFRRAWQRVLRRFADHWQPATSADLREEPAVQIPDPREAPGAPSHEAAGTHGVRD